MQMVVGVEYGLKALFLVQIEGKGFIEIDHVHSQDDHDGGQLHVDLQGKPVKKHDAEIHKKDG